MGGSLNSLSSKHSTVSASNELLELSSSTTSIPSRNEQQQQQHSSTDPFAIFANKDDDNNATKSTQQQEENSADMLADFFSGGSTAPSSTTAPPPTMTATPDIASISQPLAMQQQPRQQQQEQLITISSSIENKDIASLQSQSMPNSLASSPYSSTSSLSLAGGVQQQQPLPHTNKMVKGHHRKTSSTCSANINFGSMSAGTGLFVAKKNASVNSFKM